MRPQSCSQPVSKQRLAALYLSNRLPNDHLTLLFPKRNAVSPDSFNPVSPEYRGIISRLNLLHGSVAHRVKFLIILYVLDFDHKADLAVLTLDNHVASTLASLNIAGYAPVRAGAQQRQQKTVIERLVRVVIAYRIKQLFI